ncbi:MAG: hypothetical protein WKF79_00205 [Nocardioides sp.]
MPKLDALIAPRALLAVEIASVCVPHLIAYAVTHRAFIHAGTVSDGPDREGSTVYACEEALASIIDNAVSSMSVWLADMEGDGEPRFYRKASVRTAVSALCEAAGRMALTFEDGQSLDRLIRHLEHHNEPTMAALIESAGE